MRSCQLEAYFQTNRTEMEVSSSMGSLKYHPRDNTYNLFNVLLSSPTSHNRLVLLSNALGGV